LLGHVLQAGGHVNRITDHSEHRVIAKADIANDRLAAVYADTEIDRLI
jgi:hypothetical protein